MATRDGPRRAEQTCLDVSDGSEGVPTTGMASVLAGEGVPCASEGAAWTREGGGWTGNLYSRDYVRGNGMADR